MFFRGTGEQSRVAAPRAARGKPKTGRERLFASSSFPAKVDSTKNSPLRGRVRGFRGLLPRGRHGVNLACDAVCPMGLSHAIARATTLFAARIGHERYARDTSRVKIREDRVDAALVASRTGVRRGGVLQKHPAITGFTTGRGDRMAQRHVLERGRLNACAASAGLGTRTYGHYEVSCSRSTDDDGSLSVAARAIASERAADDAPRRNRKSREQTREMG